MIRISHKNDSLKPATSNSLFKDTSIHVDVIRNGTKQLNDSRFSVKQRQHLAQQVSSINGNRFFQNISQNSAHTNDRLNRTVQRNGETLNRIDTINTIVTWHKNYIEFVEATREWLSNNLTQYLSMTSSDPSLGLSTEDLRRITAQEFSGSSGFPLNRIVSTSEDFGSQFATAYSISSNAVGNAAELGVDKVLKKAGLGGIGALAGAFFGPMGAVVGFVVSTLIETGASALYDMAVESAGWGGEDVAMAQGSRHTGKLIRENNGRISQEAGKLRAKSYQSLNKLMAQANSATTQEVLNSIAKQTEEQITLSQKRPSPNDFSLAQKLLSIWTLEHAGDEADAREGTSEAQWEAARKRVYGGGNMGDLNNIPDIFVYQTRLHWKEAGLNGSNYIDEMFEHLRFLNRPEYSNLSSINKAEYMKFKFHKKYKYVFENNIDLRKFARLLSQFKPVHSAFLSDFASDGCRIKCVLSLDISNNSCYVNEWEYEIDSPKSGVIFTSFDVSPD